MPVYNGPCPRGQFWTSYVITYMYVITGQQSDLFIHPAIAPDPLPTVLFESLHNDLPSVATNLGGAIEILDNGNNGLLIPYNDPKKAANLINEYCSNNMLQKKHLENSKKNFKINFSSESFSKNILKEVNNLL